MPTTRRMGASTRVVRLATPSSRSMAAVRAFMVEPGSRGTRKAWFRQEMSRLGSPLGAKGSKAGPLATALRLPSRSMTSRVPKAPRLRARPSQRAFSARAWIQGSRVRVKERPASRAPFKSRSSPSSPLPVPRSPKPRSWLALLPKG